MSPTSTLPKRLQPMLATLTDAPFDDPGWGYIGHVGTGFTHKALEELHVKLVKLKAPKSPFRAKVKNESVATWVEPSLLAQMNSAEWTSKGRNASARLPPSQSRQASK